MIFSEKLVVLRKRAGLSQEDLSEKLGVTRQAVHKWETEKSMPNIEILKMLSKLFDVSLDNLLNDKEDISFKSEETAKSKKHELGKVYVSEEKIENIDVEKNNIQKTELEQKQQKEKDKRVRFTFRVGIILFIASLVFCAVCMYNGSIPASTQSFDFDADPTPQMYLVSLLLLAGIVFLGICLLTKLFMHKHLKTSNEYFNQKVTATEQKLDEAGYTHIRLQHDLAAWFFYSPAKNCFGLYFNEKEQFICPIQNYINFNHMVYGDGIVKKNKLGASFMFGAINAIGVHSTPTYSSSAGSMISFTITYFDENGCDKEYSYSLSCFRNYLFKKYGKDLAEIMILESIPKASIENYEKIKAKLDLEKNKLA